MAEELNGEMRKQGFYLKTTHARGGGICKFTSSLPKPQANQRVEPKHREYIISTGFVNLSAIDVWGPMTPCGGGLAPSL